MRCWGWSLLNDKICDLMKKSVDSPEGKAYNNGVSNRLLRQTKFIRRGGIRERVLFGEG
jgi:hypothetical protein